MPKTSAQEYQLADWVLCVRSNSLQRDDLKVELENRLVLLLLFFIDHKGEVLGKDLILKTIWPGKVVNEDSLAVAISHLRKALGDNSRSPRYIKTIPGVGYQFISDAEPRVPVAEVTLNTPVTNTSKNPSVSVWVLGVVVVVGLALGIGLSILPPSSAVAPGAQEQPQDYAQRLAQARQQLSGWQQDELLASIQSFKDLLADYPESGEAYAGIAQAKMKLLHDQLAIRENCAEVLGLLDKAIALDGGDAAPYIDRGNSYFWCKQDYRAAEQDYQQAMALAPLDDTAPLQYSQLLLALGRFDESREYLEKARQLNPLQYSVPTVVWIYQMQRRDDLALKELERIQSAEPENRFFHISAQRVYAGLGREQESFDHWLWLMRDAGFSDEDLAEVSEVFARERLTGVSRWLLERRETADLGQYVPPLSWGRYALVAGDIEQAAEHIEQAFKAHQSPLLWAAIDPAYDPLRNHPRFQAIIQALQLPANAP